MSDQLPSHDSLPQSLTEFNPSQDNLDNTDDAENLQDSLSKSGFKRRAIIHQSSDALSEIEKNGATWLPDVSEPLTFKESMQSDFMVSSSPEKGSFSGMGFQPAEYSSLQTLKCIINEAKQAERYMFSGEEHHYEVDNYMKVHFNDENEVREYFLEDDITFDRMPTSVKKTENQGLVIDFTGETVEKENEESKATSMTNDALAHSKSSYIAGSLRYSKMPEEEAASIFEQRRKELLDSLAKKGKRKNLRIFQDNDSNTARLPTSGDNHMGSPKEKSTVPGFVIFNTAKSNSNQLRGAESPLSAKKDRQKDSMLRKSLTSARSPKPQTQAVSMSQSREKKDFSSPREFSSPIAMNKDNVIKTRPPEKREVVKKEPASAPIVKTIIKDIKSPKREELSPPKVCIDAKILRTSTTGKNIKNSARDTVMTEEDKKARRETLTRINETDYDREIKSADIMPKQQQQQVKGKNKDILADIEELDQQIQQLEESKVSIDKNREQFNNSVYSEQASRDSKALFKRKTKEETTERIPSLYRNERLPSENESPGKGISSDRYKLDSEDFLIETETDNVYKRYLSERSQAESPIVHYRKSPNQDESSLNIYSQSYRSQNDRRLSNPGEYLYQKALEKKENRQQQIEKRQREKESMELSACTFAPNLRPLETSEDFETRSKNWQDQKEKRLHEIEKYHVEKEMAECTFYPSTSRKNGPMKFDPNDFYNRNMEWKKKIDDDAERHNEMARTMTMSSENKSQLNTTNNSSAKTPTVSKATEKKDDSQYSNRGYSKPLHFGNKKSNEPETIKVFSLTNDTQRSKLRPSDVQSPNLCTLEDDFSHRRRSDQIKRPTLENFVSTDLKDLLKRGTNYKSEKNETTKSKGTSPNKTPKDLLLNTSKGREGQPNHPVILTTLRDNFSSKKSPSSQNGTPLGFTDNFSKSVKNSTETSQAKGNKYYLSRKPKQPDSATMPTQQDAYSLDKKDPVMSAGYSNQSRKPSSNKVMAPGAYQLMQGSKVDQENRQFKKKPLSKGQTTSYASMELSEDQLFYYPEENRVPLGTRQSNQYNEDYLRRNASKEIASNFEKDFIEFVTTAGKEKQPSDKNVSSDGDLSKKRRTNLSLQ